MRFQKLSLIVATLLVLVWSGINPMDRVTWFFEVSPVLVALAVLIPASNRFPLSMLSYLLLFLFGLILMVGGHYTYAEVPAGNWLRDEFDLSRNNYDRLGHFMQGFVPAILVREILLRWSPLPRGFWLTVLVIATCLAISAFYELIEWWAALVLEESAEAVLGMQGDIWDTQWDMFLALVGACVSLAMLSSVHDRSLAAIRS